MATIADWRDQIDAIDRELVALLSRRCGCAREIGRLKRALALPVYEPNREAIVLANITAANHALGGSLDDAALRRLFERIIDEMRALQKQEPQP
ncbi:MAG: chorismate mutase [Terriglobales bacterium]